MFQHLLIAFDITSKKVMKQNTTFKSPSTSPPKKNNEKKVSHRLFRLSRRSLIKLRKADKYPRWLEWTRPSSQARTMVSLSSQSDIPVSLWNLGWSRGIISLSTEIAAVLDAPLFLRLSSEEQTNHGGAAGRRDLLCDIAGAGDRLPTCSQGHQGALHRRPPHTRHCYGVIRSVFTLRSMVLGRRAAVESVGFLFS